MEDVKNQDTKELQFHILKEEEYKIKQKERLAKFVINGSDHLGYVIKHILAKGDEYVIYEIESTSPNESIRVYIDTIKEVDFEPVNNLNKIKPKFDEFMAIFFKLNCHPSYKKRASTAVSIAINGDISGSEELFDQIINDISKEHHEMIQGRIAYMNGAFALSLLFIILTIYVYLTRTDQIIQQNIQFFKFLYISAFASLGGFLSISIKLNELIVEKSFSVLSYFLTGAGRIVIAVIGGIFVYLLIMSNLAFGFLGENKNYFYGVLAMCFLAGFSETLVPNSLKNLENASNQQGKKTNG